MNHLAASAKLLEVDFGNHPAVIRLPMVANGSGRQAPIGRNAIGGSQRFIHEEAVSFRGEPDVTAGRT